MKNITVIGAGPAGMMAATAAARQGARVTLLEKMPRAGKKMLITGKGRCNITNTADIEGIIQNVTGNGKFLNSSLRAFDNTATTEFFNRAGVATKVERGGRVFPVSDQAADVVNAMTALLDSLGVSVLTNTRAAKIIVADGKATGVKTADGKIFTADAVILAAGGASYPATGSSGDGATMAKAAGHTVTPLLPALVPLETAEDWVRDAQGLSLRNVRATLVIDDKKEESLFGEMLFAHFGVTGPIILSLSKNAAFALAAGKFVELELNLKPALTEEKLTARIVRDFEKNKRKTVKNAMTEFVPAKLIAPILDAAYIDETKNAGDTTKEERRRLRAALQSLMLTVTKTRPLAEAIVTAGGVSVKEINPKTMESKLVQNLFFAGEVIDIDAHTGGFNLQAAFSTGFAAGTWAAKM